MYSHLSPVLSSQIHSAASPTSPPPATTALAPVDLHLQCASPPRPVADRHPFPPSHDRAQRPRPPAPCLVADDPDPRAQRHDRREIRHRAMTEARAAPSATRRRPNPPSTTRRPQSSTTSPASFIPVTRTPRYPLSGAPPPNHQRPPTVTPATHIDQHASDDQRPPQPSPALLLAASITIVPPPALVDHASPQQRHQHSTSAHQSHRRPPAASPSSPRPDAAQPHARSHRSWSRPRRRRALSPAAPPPHPVGKILLS